MRFPRNVYALCALTAFGLRAQTLTTVHSFDFTDGSLPQSGLVQASNGDLYGTTSGGGTYGSGTVFKIKPDGALTTIYNFCSQSLCADGGNPLSALLPTGNGDLYGTTVGGGVTGPYTQVGTIFKIDASGTFTTLYTFCSQTGCPDGEYPQGLIRARNGDFFGTTEQGGAHQSGTLFEMTPSGELTTLYNFCSLSECTDGSFPNGIIQADNGEFYGTTSQGGITCPNGGGCGTFFKFTPSGTLTTLYSFCSEPGCADGSGPYAPPLQATDGNFYGTTAQGGALGESGTVFRITPSGALTTYNFCSPSACSLSYGPTWLTQGTNGRLFGITEQGGGNESSDCPYGCGTVFEITPGGQVTIVYNFCSQAGCTDGFFPLSRLVQYTDGAFYGATWEGGAYTAYGTIFRLSLDLPPFVETQPGSGVVGAKVEILGTNLVGATSVSFNGIPAKFEVASSALIETKVPSGSTSGKVKVVTPKGTLSSYPPFEVLP